ncbi:hypothetical protein Rhopal_004341-T1 [Rhodotorula paludigena]|uniref:Uncharacterized protein n=1 Tax=Rhodotorula paludigena TaxID=86838 RepID=A0AAV5GP73_9BASI|nr:hypothetical protein Rhopal_004341-T1 [Rhodotorula paludigena]
MLETDVSMALWMGIPIFVAGQELHRHVRRAVRVLHNLGKIRIRPIPLTFPVDLSDGSTVNISLNCAYISSPHFDSPGSITFFASSFSRFHAWGGPLAARLELETRLFERQFISRAHPMSRATKFGQTALTDANIILVNPASALDFILFVKNNPADLAQQSILDYACLRWTKERAEFENGNMTPEQAEEFTQKEEKNRAVQATEWEHLAENKQLYLSRLEEKLAVSRKNRTTLDSASSILHLQDEAPAKEAAMSLAAYRSALLQDRNSHRLELLHDGQAVVSSQNISVHNGIRVALDQRKRRNKKLRKRNAAEASARTRFRATSRRAQAAKLGVNYDKYVASLEPKRLKRALYRSRKLEQDIQEQTPEPADAVRDPGSTAGSGPAPDKARVVLIRSGYNKASLKAQRCAVLASVPHLMILYQSKVVDSGKSEDCFWTGRTKILKASARRLNAAIVDAAQGASRFQKEKGYGV